MVLGTMLSVYHYISDRLSGRRERTFIMIKPDGVERGLVGEIVTRFEGKGLKLVAMKFMQSSVEHLRQHYDDLADKPFFPGLVRYMSSGPLVPMIWEGQDAVKTGRAILGETRPQDSAPGTIRGDFALHVGRNIVHGSDSVASAEREIWLWFRSSEISTWTPSDECWVYED